MEIKRLGNNETQLSIKGVGTILFSYETPVAALTPWLNGADAREVDQEVLNNLVK